MRMIKSKINLMDIDRIARLEDKDIKGNSTLEDLRQKARNISTRVHVLENILKSITQTDLERLTKERDFRKFQKD